VRIAALRFTATGARLCGTTITAIGTEIKAIKQKEKQSFGCIRSIRSIRPIGVLSSLMQAQISDV